jgi:hypothetical protein
VLSGVTSALSTDWSYFRDDAEDRDVGQVFEVIIAAVCYAFGASLGFLVTRGGTPVWWSHMIRAQLLIAGFTLAVIAGWNIDAGVEVVQAAAVAAVLVAIYAVAVFTRGTRTVGESLVDGWACAPNTGFWVIPMATVLLGPAGTVLAVLADQLNAPVNAWVISRLRAQAPIPQHARTRVTDYAGLIGLASGFVAGRFSEPPYWSGRVLMVAGPLLAVLGAAMWSGSVRHLLGKLGAPVRGDWRRFAMLVTVRVVCCVIIAALWWGEPIAVVAILAAAGAPAFNPANLTVLYGYKSHVVAIAAKWGWLAVPVGVLLAALATAAV